MKNKIRKENPTKGKRKRERKKGCFSLSFFERKKERKKMKKGKVKSRKKILKKVKERKKERKWT